jgi:hypothetical protein
MNCALVREIKRYSSAGRMVLTGTPLHVGFLLFFFSGASDADVHHP